MDEFEDKNKKLSVNLELVKEHNITIKEALPELENHIIELEQQLKNIDQLELTSDIIL